MCRAEIEINKQKKSYDSESLMVWWGVVLWYHKLKIGFHTAVTGFDRVRFDKTGRKAATILQPDLFLSYSTDPQ